MTHKTPALTHPHLKLDLPVYPHLMQVVRVTVGTVPGPAGYMSSSVLGPSLYVAFVQQLKTDTLLPRDREPCLALDLNNFGLIPGYYNGRLSGSYKGLPIYSVGAGTTTFNVPFVPITGSSSIPSQSSGGLNPAQVQALSTLAPVQLAALNNLTSCQLQTLLTALPISQIQTLTLQLTSTQLANFINTMSVTQLTNLYNQLTISQISYLSSTLNFNQLSTLTTALTPAQILTISTSLTNSQLQTLTSYPISTISALLSNVSSGTLSTSNLVSLLNITPLPGNPINIGFIQTASFTSGTQNNVPIYGTIFNVPTTASTTITGIIPLNIGSSQKVTIANTGISTISIPNKSSLSISRDQFATSTGTVISIGAGASATFDYNPTTGYWTDSASSVSVAGGGGTTSPLTTKGDLWGYDLTNNRIPIGADGQVLAANSTESLGVKWSPIGGSVGTRINGTLTAAGSTQGDAAPIVTDNVIVSGADGTKGVILPSNPSIITVVNNELLNNLKVYPNSGAQISADGVNVAANLGGSNRNMYVQVSSTQWYIVLLN